MEPEEAMEVLVPQIGRTQEIPWINWIFILKYIEIY
jgi:hypothetical protein